MNLHFKKIRWKNLLSTGNIFTEISFTDHRMCLIVGENGAGKSTLLDVLCFILFNKPFRKINKPQLVNALTKKDCVGEVEFTTRGSHYRIVRGMKPSIFEIWKDGVLLNQDAKNVDYQSVLERQILKTNFKTFCQIVILGSASFVPFMQLPGGDRRKITEDLLDLNIFTSMNSLLKNHFSGVETVLRDLEREKELLVSKLEITRKHTEQLVEEKQKRIDDVVTKILETEEDLIDTWSWIKTKKEEVEKLLPEIAQNGKLEKRIKKAMGIKHELNAKINGLIQDIRFLEDHDNCPTCNQVIDESFKENTKGAKGCLVDQTRDGLELLDKEIAVIEKNLAEISLVNKRISELNVEIYVLNAKVDTAQNHLRTLNKEREKLQNEQAESIDENALIDLENKVDALLKQKGDIENDKYMMEYVSVLLKDTGIKSKIIKQFVPIINKLINKYLAALDFFVDFHMDENFEETIKSRGRDDFSYNSFSEGEKMRIDLAVLFAWRAVAKLRSSINTNLLIMDEVFDGSLDGAGIEEFIKILHSITEDNNVFVISHKTDQLWDKFAQVIKFEKHQNFSRIA